MICIRCALTRRLHLSVVMGVFLLFMGLDKIDWLMDSGILTRRFARRDDCGILTRRFSRRDNWASIL